MTVPTRVGNSCASKEKVVVVHMDQPTPSVILRSMANMMNTKPEGISTRNLHTLGHEESFILGGQGEMYKLTPLVENPHQLETSQTQV